MRRFIAFSVVALAAAALSACGDSGGSTPCGTLANLPAPQLLYPIPGAVGVPDSPLYIVVSGVGPAYGSIYLKPPTGSNIYANALGPVPSPAPSPAASAPAGSTLLAAPIPSLAAGTAYGVYFNANGASPCVQGQVSGSIGSFTTQ
jgi:hypothetical protein